MQHHRIDMIEDLIKNSTCWSERDRYVLTNMATDNLRKIHDICMNGVVRDPSSPSPSRPAQKK